MTTTADSVALLRAEIERLRQQLHDAEQTILALRSGGVDAFVMHGPDGDQIYALQSADRPYRLLVESMQQGAATLQTDGVILYFNRRLAELLSADPAKFPGAAVTEFVPSDQLAVWQALLAQGAAGASSGETYLLRGDGRRLPVHLTLSALPRAGQRLISLLVSDSSEHEVRREAERLADRLGRLLAFTAARSEAWTVEQVADVIVRHGLPAVGANSALLALVTDDGRQFQVLRLHGYAADIVERSRLIPAEAGWMLTDCLRTGQMLVFGQVRANRVVQLETPDAFGCFVDESAIALFAVPQRGLHLRSPGAFAFQFAVGRAFGIVEPASFERQGAVTGQCRQELQFVGREGSVGRKPEPENAHAAILHDERHDHGSAVASLGMDVALAGIAGAALFPS